ncbi:transporter associated domain-containing protein [Pseudomonas sp. RIT-PI-S]|uniref:transporter associated domain-containing protein n=1 Tax=Pseudomonas sp. RIT-PI-S TaxID=3035295 RepID=UPI0021D9C0C1|nr:transporter associated domain-containing protein [Pseudomonas sp. RIT-PI-S]
MMPMPVAPAAGAIFLALLWSAGLGAVDHARRARQPRGQQASDSERGGLALARLLFQVVIVSVAVLLGEQAGGAAGVMAGAALAWLAIVLFTTALPRWLAQRHASAFEAPGRLLWLPVRLLAPVAGLQQRLATPTGAGLSARPHKGNGSAAQSTALNEAQEAEARASRQGVTTGIMGLDRMTVNDILVPRHEVDGLDLDDPLEQIIDQLMISRHTRLPVFRGDINQVDKVVNTRQISHLLPSRSLTEAALMAACYDAYFVPEGTPLHIQLLNFHKQQRRLGMVVDEYGEVLGLVTLEDILEEIVGEFESEQVGSHPHVFPQADGRYILDGAASLRDLNKVLGWHLPSDGPKTLNGLVTEALESIPERAVCLKIGRYRMEILETEENRVKRLLAWQHTASPPPA